MIDALHFIRPLWLMAIPVMALTWWLVRDKAAVLVSHRFSTVRMADRIYVLERGRVVERDANGKPLRAAGTHMDVTAARQAQERLDPGDPLHERQAVRVFAEHEADVVGHADPVLPTPCEGEF